MIILPLQIPRQTLKAKNRYREHSFLGEMLFLVTLNDTQCVRRSVLSKLSKMSNFMIETSITAQSRKVKGNTHIYKA